MNRDLQLMHIENTALVERLLALLGHNILLHVVYKRASEEKVRIQ